MNILDKIKLLQKQHGFNESELSKAAKLTQSTISSLYRNNNVPTIPTLEAICSAFDITLAQFFLEDEDLANLSSNQKRLVSGWNKLDNKQKQAIIDLIETM